MVAIAALAFGLLALSAAALPRLPGDLELALAVQTAVPPLLRSLLEAVAVLGEAVVTIPLTLGAAALLWITGRRGPALLMPLTLLPDGMNYFIKELIGRPRPDPALLLVHPAAATGLSFPSGHAVHFAVFFGLVALALPTWWPLPGVARRALVTGCVALVLLAGVGRVALGVHWPSDVLGGYLLGLLYLHALLMLNHRFGGYPAPPPREQAAPAHPPASGESG